MPCSYCNTSSGLKCVLCDCYVACNCHRCHAGHAHAWRIPVERLCSYRTDGAPDAPWCKKPATGKDARGLDACADHASRGSDRCTAYDGGQCVRHAGHDGNHDPGEI